MACCDDPRVRRERPFPAVMAVLAAILLVAGGALLILLARILHEGFGIQA